MDSGLQAIGILVVCKLMDVLHLLRVLAIVDGKPRSISVPVIYIVVHVRTRLASVKGGPQSMSIPVVYKLVHLYIRSGLVTGRRGGPRAVW